MIEPRKWLDGDDISPGKRVGVVISWSRRQRSGTILSLNFDNTTCQVSVIQKNIKSNTWDPYLIVGEEVEMNVVNWDTNEPFAIDVSGSYNTCVQCDTISPYNKYKKTLKVVVVVIAVIVAVYFPGYFSNSSL